MLLQQLLIMSLPTIGPERVSYEYEKIAENRASFAS